MVVIIMDPQCGQHADIVRGLEGIPGISPFTPQEEVKHRKRDGDQNSSAKGHQQVETIIFTRMPFFRDGFEQRLPVQFAAFFSQAVSVPGQG